MGVYRVCVSHGWRDVLNVAGADATTTVQLTRHFCFSRSGFPGAVRPIQRESCTDSKIRIPRPC